MFSDKVLHPSKPEEPPLPDTCDSICINYAVGGGGGGSGGVGRAEDGEGKRVCDKTQRQK